MIHIDVTLLTVVVGSVIPFLTGLVGKERNATLRILINGLLASAAGAVTIAIAQGGNVAWQGWLLSIVVTWMSSTLTYQGLWGPTGLVDRFVEWGAKQLERIGIHLPQAEVLDVEHIVNLLFGDAVHFLTEEEAKLLGQVKVSVPDPGTGI